jgi:ATP-binding cassette subfamily B protein
LAHAVIEVSENASVDLKSGHPGSIGSLLGSFLIVANHHRMGLSQEGLIRDHGLGSGDVSVAEVLRIARAGGLRADATRVRWNDLFNMGPALPAILLLRNGTAMVLLRAQAKLPGWPRIVVLRDPNSHEEAPLVLDEARLTAAWDGDVILIKRVFALRDENRPFGVGWIVGQLLRDRRVARDIIVSSFFLGLLAASPIVFWRVMIDRVLYYRSMSTFWMLCTVFLALLAFETVYGHLRRHLVLFIVARTDTKLWKYIFEKLLNLPIDYFERNTSGEILHNMFEIIRIRDFLKTQLFGSILDGIVIVLFLPVMFMVSTVMTACVLALCLLTCLWIVAMLPTIRHTVAEAVKAEAERGTQLVEAIHGIRAIKSLALDSRQRHEWEKRIAKVAQTRFEEGCASGLVQSVVHPLQMMMTTGVVVVAVYLALVNQNTMYVGAIFAFIIMTQRVTMPVVQMAHSIVEINETRIGIAGVGNVVNQAPEEGRSGHGIRTPFRGRIEFNEVTFRYLGAQMPALDRVSFSVPEGSVFGVVGRSGSGKTTVTRLLQGLHSNYHGLIKIDGNDLREIDVDHLRASLGVVLQENFLFRGSLRETIAAAKPNARFEEVVAAARLAGAEEFIEKLPAGYETFIQEGSTNLSGGQRQRLAIARALIGNPRILMLDEATSALDADSEAIVNANLLRIAKGRTLIIISHRLSALVMADQILVLEKGAVYDIGTHAELLERCDIYAGLWHLQHRHLHTRPSPHEIVPVHSAAAQ